MLVIASGWVANFFFLSNNFSHHQEQNTINTNLLSHVKWPRQPKLKSQTRQVEWGQCNLMWPLKMYFKSKHIKLQEKCVISFFIQRQCRSGFMRTMLLRWAESNHLHSSTPKVLVLISTGATDFCVLHQHPMWSEKPFPNGVWCRVGRGVCAEVRTVRINGTHPPSIHKQKCFLLSHKKLRLQVVVVLRVTWDPLSQDDMSKGPCGL